MKTKFLRTFHVKWNRLLQSKKSTKTLLLF
jgi:hypothetical protein